MKASMKGGVLQPSELSAWLQEGRPFILIDVLPEEIYLCRSSAESREAAEGAEKRLRLG